MTTGFDASVFRESVPPEDVVARSRGARLRSAALLVLVAVACLAVWLLCSMAIAEAAVDSFSLDTSSLNIGSVIFAGGVIAAGIGFLLQGRGEDPRVVAARLRRFVERNGLFHKVEPKAPKFEGVIFGEGHEPRSAVRFRSGPAHPFSFEIASYSYRLASGLRDSSERDSQVSWTYIAITADRILPRILLDARANDYWFVSSVPVSLAKSQLVPLAGDHGGDFEAYAPAGYEDQALQIFTPEILDLLVRDAPSFDVETVDNQIIFFTRKTMNLNQGAAWEQLSQLVFGVGAAMVGQTASQPADRFGRNATLAVAEAGRTLRRRRITPSLLWFAGAGALLLVARMLLTGPWEGLL